MALWGGGGAYLARFKDKNTGDKTFAFRSQACCRALRHTPSEQQLVSMGGERKRAALLSTFVLRVCVCVYAVTCHQDHVQFLLHRKAYSASIRQWGQVCSMCRYSNQWKFGLSIHMYWPGSARFDSPLQPSAEGICISIITGIPV